MRRGGGFGYTRKKGGTSEMISYAPLFETMKRRGVTSYRLERMGFSRATYYSIKQGNSVSTNTIDQLCTLLHCTVGEVMEFIEPEGDN